MIKVDVIDDSTDKIFTTIELEDDTIAIIEKLGLSVEDAVVGAFKMIVEEYDKNPKAFENKYKKLAKKYDVPVADGVS